MTLLQIALNEINSKDSYESIKLILNHKDFPHKEKIRFAFDCAKDLDKHYDLKKYPEVKKIRDKCLELIADWLLGKSIDKKELDAAARAAYVAANAADAAGNAAYATAKAVNAAAYAVNAANAAANAAYAAAKAAYAAAYAAANAVNAVNAAYAAARAANAAAYAAAYAANAAGNAAYAAANREEYLKSLLHKLIKQVTNFSKANEETIDVLYF